MGALLLSNNDSGSAPAEMQATTILLTSLKKNVFQGTILRSQLCILLWEQVYFTEQELLQHHVDGTEPPRLAWKIFRRYYPRCPTIGDVVERIPHSAYNFYVNLVPYLNASAPVSIDLRQLVVFTTYSSQCACAISRLSIPKIASWE